MRSLANLQHHQSEVVNQFRRGSVSLSQKGFTLIELLIVVAIIGILATIAAPNYREYVIRSKLPEAFSGLSDGRIKLEQFYQDNRSYAGGSSPCPAATENFTFACDGLSATAYTITATGIGNISAFVYTIDQANTKTSNTSWGNSTNCWVRSSGGSC